jgi:hypothetical protein
VIVANVANVAGVRLKAASVEAAAMEAAQAAASEAAAAEAAAAEAAAVEAAAAEAAAAEAAAASSTGAAAAAATPAARISADRGERQSANHEKSRKCSLDRWSHVSFSLPRCLEYPTQLLSTRRHGLNYQSRNSSWWTSRKACDLKLSRIACLLENHCEYLDRRHRLDGSKLRVGAILRGAVRREGPAGFCVQTGTLPIRLSLRGFNPKPDRGILTTMA